MILLQIGLEHTFLNLTSKHEISIKRQFQLDCGGNMGENQNKKTVNTLYFKGLRFFSVRMKGLEPPRLAAPDPKSGAAANYATSALFIVLLIYIYF
jgi:hypothetical protein